MLGGVSPGFNTCKTHKIPVYVITNDIRLPFSRFEIGRRSPGYLGLLPFNNMCSVLDIRYNVSCRAFGAKVLNYWKSMVFYTLDDFLSI